MNHHVALKTAKVDIRRALAILELCPELELDEQLKLSTLEGETELTEIVSLLLAESEDDEGTIAAVKAQIDVRRERIARFERRIETRRNAVISLMDTARLTKLALPEATVSLRTLPAAPKVADEDALSDTYCKLIRKPDMEAIRDAFKQGIPIPGVVISNGGASLTIRRK